MPRCRPAQALDTRGHWARMVTAYQNLALCFEGRPLGARLCGFRLVVCGGPAYRPVSVFLRRECCANVGAGWRRIIPFFCCSP